MSRRQAAVAAAVEGVPMPTYEVYAIKYADQDRKSSVNFIGGGDPHDGPMPIDYYTWLICNGSVQYVVDTGFNQETAAARGRHFIRCPTEGLKLMGVSADSVKDVVLTHLHYDHVGNFNLFPMARYHLQDLEMQFATGRHMAHRFFHEAFNVEDVTGMVRQVYAGRVQFHDGDATLAPGISLHLVGGHTKGLQVVRVHTARGWVVLASDASHYYANMEEGRPFPIVCDVGEMIEGWGRLAQLAESANHVIPGHDPDVLVRYPAPRLDLRGIVAALHHSPIQGPGSD